MTDQAIKISIETIKHMTFCGCCTTGPCNECNRYISKNTAIEALEKQINDRWIPVSERLPCKIEEAIACDNDGIIVIGYIKKRIDYYVCEHLPFVTEDIIAWKPLPESYKERE